MDRPPPPPEISAPTAPAPVRDSLSAEVRESVLLLLLSLLVTAGVAAAASVLLSALG